MLTKTIEFCSSRVHNLSVCVRYCRKSFWKNFEILITYQIPHRVVPRELKHKRFSSNQRTRREHPFGAFFTYINNKRFCRTNKTTDNYRNYFNPLKMQRRTLFSIVLFIIHRDHILLSIKICKKKPLLTEPKSYASSCLLDDCEMRGRRGRENVSLCVGLTSAYAHG